MKGGNSYMHEDCSDFYIEVLKVQYRGPDYIKIKYYSMNLGYTGKPWMLPVKQPSTLKIMKKDLLKWKQIDPLTHRNWSEK